MNRQQRRKYLRAVAKNEAKIAKAANRTGLIQSDTVDFSTVPTATMCMSIQLMIEELKSRGCRIRDFDHKEKVVEQIQILGENIYFLSQQEE